MNMLICGGNGFIGKNLVSHFSTNDMFNVRSTYYNTVPNKLPNVDYAQADLRNSQEVKNVLKDIDIVLQYAATSTGAKDIIAKPYMHVTDNAIINSLLIRQSFESNVKHFIFPSCTIMYKHGTKPLKENDFNENDGIYEKYYGAGNTKVYLEKMCKFFASFNKTKFTVLRQSNIYGPHDKYNLENSHVLGATITKTMSPSNEITVWGDGSEQRDFLFVEDLIDLIKIILDKQKTNYQLINASYGESISISDLVNMINNISKKNKMIKYDKSKPTLPINIHINNNKANELFNWRPKTKLPVGLKKAIDWYEKIS